MTETSIYMPGTALIVVDMQRDFALTDGSLYVKGGEQLIEPITEEVIAARTAGAKVIYTQDWHPEHTPHFEQDGGTWPVHCVMETPGADLVVPVMGPTVKKGSGHEDSYSGFSVLNLETGATEHTELDGILQSVNAKTVVVVGLAGDWCVKETAIDAAKLGYQVVVPLDRTRFVELVPGDTRRAIQAMLDAGVRVLPVS